MCADYLPFRQHRSGISRKQLSQLAELTASQLFHLSQSARWSSHSSPVESVFTSDFWLCCLSRSSTESQTGLFASSKVALALVLHHWLNQQLLCFKQAAVGSTTSCGMSPSELLLISWATARLRAQQQRFCPAETSSVTGFLLGAIGWKFKREQSLLESFADRPFVFLEAANRTTSDVLHVLVAP